MTTNHPVPTPPPAEPAASLRPVESQATVDLIYEMAEAIEDADSCRQERIYYVTLARGALGPVADRLAAADRENAELRGEVERLRPMVEDTEGVILRKQEDVDEIATQLAAAQAQLAEAQEVGDLNGQEADNLLARAEAAEARLEAVRAIVRDIDSECPDAEQGRSQWWEAMDSVRAELRAALSAAPQPEPDLLLGALPTHLAYISRTVTASYREGMDPELVMRRRLGKVNVEAGEMWDAVEGWTGENPRKGVYASREDVVKELIDCASASLCALEHMTGDKGDALGMLAAQVAGNAQRLSESIPDRCVAPEPPASDEPALHPGIAFWAKHEGHDVGQRHEGGSLLSATCHDCGETYRRSDEPARCEHGQTRAHGYYGDDCELFQCPGPTAPATAECRHCNGSGNARTFDGDGLGICGTCHGTGSAAGGGL